MTKPKIDEILDEIEQLDKAAPPAPWTAFPCHYAHPNRGDSPSLSHSTFQAWAVDSSGPDEDRAVACFDDCREEDQQAAAKLTAYIRNHAPTLVAEIRRLRHATRANDCLSTTFHHATGVIEIRPTTNDEGKIDSKPNEIVNALTSFLDWLRTKNPEIFESRCQAKVE